MANIGKISQIMGAVVDVTFEDGNLPEIMNALHVEREDEGDLILEVCLLYTSPSPRDGLLSRMPSSA